MYNCSAEFHNAIANGNEQVALLLFNDCVFTDSDIVIDQGIEFSDNFNLEEDLSIGQTPSNEIGFSLVNESRLLNSYTFGDFMAAVGVYLGQSQYVVGSGEVVRCVVGNNVYTGFSNYPYFKRNGAATASQPGFAVASILCYDGIVYAFGNSGQYIVYDNASGAAVTGNHPMNSFMQNKSGEWIGKGVYYDKSNNKMRVWHGGLIRDYEYCPLGWFTAERPKAPDVIQISMNCYDYMQKFEKDMRDVSVTFPITIQNLFIRLCQVAEVEYILPNPFINGSAVIQSRPEDFDNVTMREVLKWIAEASCSNARFNRDGKLILDWLHLNTGQVYGADRYSEFNPYWYETKRVTKLYNNDTQGSTQSTHGSGDEAYLIQDNPLLRGV